MRLIIGLGNPGRQYAITRHNIGFMLIDLLANTFRASSLPANKWSQLRRANIRGEQVLLVQPQTYMNRSGIAVKEVVDQYQTSPEHLIVIYDDLDLEVGRLRIRSRGGHGGHKGVESIIEHLETNEFTRLRFGIGRPQAEGSQQARPDRNHVVDYVLEPFQQDEQKIITETMGRSVDAIVLILNDQIDRAMNLYNRV
jgi:PTH1 family peptidyl-tRNA hydrolase